MSSQQTNMAPVIAYTLPTMQLVCNLVMLQTPSSDNTSPDWIANGTAPEDPSVVGPEGYIPHPDIKVAYKVYKGEFTWKAARLKCNSEGARLAVIDSYIKLEYLLNQAPGMNAIHIGVHSMYDFTEWVGATTGSTIASPPWGPGYPKAPYTCVLAGYNPRGLRNHACSTKANYACELPINN